MKVELGKIVATPGALRAVSELCIMQALFRHVQGDWGDVCREDREANDWALSHGERLLSSYHTKEHVKFWIITEADRSVTTVLLPEEY